MLSIHNLAMAYGARTLFSQATMQFDAGSRYGIVGANGSGKSTLLRILAGQEEASDGTLSIPKSARLGVLEQDHFQFEEVPILDVVMGGITELWAAIQEKERLLAAVGEGEEFDGDRYSELEDIVLAHDGYTLEPRAAEILEGLNIPARVHRDPLSTLSGGYKLRVLLARTLASDPDVLLLDEPTNHLDIVSIAWLERFLVAYRGCALVVSHDHRFLDTVSTHTVDVDYERVTLYTGNYTAFTLAKVADRERKEAEIAKREATIEAHKVFVDRFKAKASKARQAQSKVKAIERIERSGMDKLPESSRRHPRFKLEPRRQTGKQVVEVRKVCKAFGDKVVLDDVSFTMQRGDRVAIIGPNGIGKSTLLKIMVGQLAADAGEVEWGHEAEPGMFSQDHAELEACSESDLLNWLWTLCPDKPMGFVRGKLAEVLFSKDEVEKKIGALSGGEMARLAFAGLGVRQPTVLVLDEPTNHLDLEGIESLAVGLEAYEGPILFVSHDRWFVSRLATRIIEISETGVEDYRGCYDEFLAWRESHQARRVQPHEHQLA